MDYKVSVEQELKAEDSEVISQGLKEANSPFFGHKMTQNFAVTIRDANGEIVGGVLTWMRTGLGLLCIDTLWVAPDLRRQGYGTKLVLAAEKEGKRHGCTHAQVETTSFQSQDFYQKIGYSQIGRVDKLFGDYDYIFMRKDLK